MAEAKILVADDSPTELQLMAEPLIARGYQVITAANGDEALKTARQERPALILLDILMPGKNGFLVRKGDPRDERVTLLEITARGKQALKNTEKERVESLGYILEDFSEEEKHQILEQIRKILKKDKSSLRERE